MNDKFSHIKWWNNKRKEKNDLNNCETYNRLKNMSEQELMFEYINAKVNYRHQKNIWILNIVLATLALLNICKACAAFMNQVRKTAVSCQTNQEVIMKVGFSIAGILTIAAIILVLILLFSYTKWLKESYKRVLFAALILECRRKQTLYFHVDEKLVFIICKQIVNRKEVSYNKSGFVKCKI